MALSRAQEGEKREEEVVIGATVAEEKEIGRNIDASAGCRARNKTEALK